MTRWGKVVAALAAVTVLSVAGCSDSTGSRPPTTTDFVPLPATGHGTVLTQSPLVVKPALAGLVSQATTVTYTSTSGLNGAAVRVSGVVLVPKGAAPQGGWPIVALAHGTTGVDDTCAISANPDLLGWADKAGELIKAGYVVTATDYQGVGTPGENPFLEPNSAAFNVIDSVYAAKAVVADASSRWAAYGESQGGQASWAAAEMENSYASGLDFVGSANVAPAADLTPIAPSGTLASDLTLYQQALIPDLISGLKVAQPSINVNDYVHGPLAQNMTTFTTCTPNSGVAKAGITLGLKPQDTLPATPEAGKTLSDWLATISLPKRKASAPMLVIYGDDDTVIRPAWTAGAVQKACKLGDTVKEVVRPGEGHSNLDSEPTVISWLGDRFAGKPAPNTC